MRAKVSYILVLMICAVFQVTARSYQLRGHVYDANGEPLPYVNIYIEKLNQGTITDVKGAFSYNCTLTNEDTLRVKFSFVGFEEVIKRVIVADDSPITVYMKEISKELDQVELGVYRKQESSVELLDIGKVSVIPSAAGGGIESLISTQAGVSMNNELSSQYSVRGGNYDENSVYVNSIEVYRPMLIRSGEQEGLSFVNPDMVEQVSFSSGCFSVEYGDKMSSVLDIRYKKPTHFEGSASVSLLGASAYIGNTNKSFSQMHGIRYKTSSYMLGSLQTDAEYDPNFLDYQTYLTYDFSERWKLSFLGNISRNDYRFRPVSRMTSFGTLNEVKQFVVNFKGQEKDLFLTYFGSLSLSFQPNKKTSLEVITSDFHTSERVTYDIDGSYWLTDVMGDKSVFVDTAKGRGNYHEHARDNLEATVANVSVLGTHKLGFNQLKWGVTYQRNIVDDKTNEWESRDSAGYSMPYNEDRMSLYDNLTAEQTMKSNRFSAYIQDTYTRNHLKGKITMIGGVRLSYYDFNEEFLASPRFSFAFFPNKHPNWGIRLATGIYYQSIFYKEVKREVSDMEGNSTIELNREVKSPRSYQLLMASDYYFKVRGKPFKFSSEIYGKYIDRIISYTVDNTQIIYSGINDANGFAAGADMKLFGEFVPGTDSWLSLSLMRTMENIYGDGIGYIYRPTDQFYNASFFFQDYFPGYEKLKFNIKFIWAQGMPCSPPDLPELRSAFRLGNYRRLDIGAVFQLVKGKDKVMERKFFSWMRQFSLNLDVFNVLDIRNENSCYWVKDFSGNQNSVPNYLTGRRFNFKIQVDF